MLSEWILQLVIAWLNAIFRWQPAHLWMCAFIIKDRKRCCFSGSLFFCPLICVAKFGDIEMSVRSFCNMLAGWRHVKLSKSTTCSHCAGADTVHTWLHSYSLLINKEFILVQQQIINDVWWSEIRICMAFLYRNNGLTL